MSTEKREPPWWLTSIVAPVLVAAVFGVGSWLVIGAETKTAVAEHERRLGVLEEKIDEKASADELKILRDEIKGVDAKVTQILLILSTSTRPK